MATMPTADAAAFLGKATMQLLEHKSEAHKEVAAVIPAILTVLNGESCRRELSTAHVPVGRHSLADSKIAKSPSGEVLHRFLQWFHMSAGRPTAATVRTRKSAKTDHIVSLLVPWCRILSNAGGLER
jgi:hypothetical protein